MTAPPTEATSDGFGPLLAELEPAAFVTDLDGRVVAVSQRFCDLVACEHGELIGVRRPYPWWPRDQHKWLAAQLGHGLESAANRTRFEGRHVAADGREFHVTGTVSQLSGDRGRPQQLLWVLRTNPASPGIAGTAPSPGATADADDLDLELALRRLFESNLIGIITGERDRVETANDAFLDMLGYSRSDVAAGLDWPALTPPEWLEVDARAGEQMLRSGRSGPIEKEYLRRDGSRVRVRIAGAVVSWEPFRWVSFVEDVTDLARQTDRLAEANRRLNELIGMAAHDLRTPIATMRGFAELLLQRPGPALDDDARTLLRNIETSADQMITLVNDLLALSEVERGHVRVALRRQDLNLVVAAAAGLIRPVAAGKGTTVVAELAPVGIPVDVDAGKMEQVMTNLLSNAVKYAPAGSTVTLRTRVAGTLAVAEVEDEGPGITAEQQETIFQPFATAAATPTGGESSTGLGLTIVRRIVEEHGGRIGVRSAAGGGAVFTVSLPLADTGPARP